MEDEGKKRLPRSMYKKYEGREKITAYIEPELKKEIVRIANQHSLTISGVISLLLSFGLQTFIRAYKPEELLTPEIWNKIIEASKIKE